MSFSYNFGNNPPIDYPRFLIADTQQFLPDGITRAYIFEDSEITMASNLCVAAFIYPTGGGQTVFNGQPSYWYTAAALAESLASNRARLAGALQVLDVKIDLTTAARFYRDMAESFRQTERNNGGFAVIETAGDPFSARSRLYNQLIRLQN